MVLDDVGIRQTLREAVGGPTPLNVRIINGVQDLTAADRQALLAEGIAVSEDLDGFVSGRELVVNRARANTRVEVSLLAAHEILGHYGMRALHGPNLNATLDRYFGRLGGLRGVVQQAQQFGVSIPDQYAGQYQRARTGDRNAQRAVVQEMFAAAAESNQLNPGSPVANAVSDFVSRVKGFLARFPVIGRMFNGFTERDIMRVVRDAGRAARRTTAPDAVGPVDTAASIGGIRNRLAGIKPEDHVIIGADGKSTVIKVAETGRDADGKPVTFVNKVDTVDDIDAAATDRVKQAAQNAAQAVLGTATDQLSTKRDPIKRRPDQGKLRTKLRESSALLKFQEAFIDSQEKLRRTAKGLNQFLQASPEATASIVTSIDESLETTIARLEEVPEGKTVDEDAVAEQTRLVDAVRREFDQTFESSNEQDIHDALSLHTKAVRYKGLAAEDFRNNVVERDAALKEAVDATSAIRKTTPEETVRTASTVAFALKTLESNRAAFLMRHPLEGEAATQRKEILDKVSELNKAGSELQPSLAKSFREQLERIVAESFESPEAYADAFARVNTTGMTTEAALEALNVAGVTETNYGDFTAIIENLQSQVAATQKMRVTTLPQAYFNEQALFGFKHDFPIARARNDKDTLLADRFTQSHHLDYTSESERKSQFSNDVINNTRVQSHLASQATHFNNEVLRSLAMNVLASQGSDLHREKTSNFYDVKRLDIISKSSEQFQRWVTNQEEGKNTGRFFMYAVPNSDAVVAMEFDTISSSPKQIRGERKGEELREFTALKTARFVNGATARMMTRYNANFVPRSHVREFLTAGFFLTADEGLKAAGTYLSRTLDNNVAAPEIYQYMRARNQRTPEGQRKQAELLRKSATVRQLKELIDQGGLVTQLAGFNEPGQTGLDPRGRGGLARSGQAVDNLLGSLSDTTDAIVRLSAYQAQLSQGKSKQEAAAYAKRLANFEQRGKYGGPLGDAIMFFNPAAAGAGRAIESLLEGEFARPTLMAAVGAGMSIGFLSAALAGEDEQTGENLYDREGLDRQTTDLRLPVSGDLAASMPAGFSVGSLGVLFGVQLAGFLRGQQDVSQLASNTLEILLNNFSPVPSSSIPLVDSQGDARPIRYLFDTFTPTALKPVLQFQANLNGLGLPIYRTGFSNTAGGFTDAFNGRESDIGTWSDRMAVAMHEATGGRIDVNPGSLRHFMSSYFTGINTVMDFGAEVYNLQDGVGAGSTFVDRSLGFGGFFSRLGHNDEYYQTRKEVEALSKQLKTYEATGRDELANSLRARLPGNFDDLIKQINRNRRLQDEVNSEMRPLLYGNQYSAGQKRQARDVQNERRRLLQQEGLTLLRQATGQ